MFQQHHTSKLLDSKCPAHDLTESNFGSGLSVWSATKLKNINPVESKNHAQSMTEGLIINLLGISICRGGKELLYYGYETLLLFYVEKKL